MSTKITLWGTARPDLRRPSGDAGLPAGHGARAGRLPGRLERPVHHRPDRGRRGSTCAARSTAPSSTRSSTGSSDGETDGDERLRLAPPSPTGSSPLISERRRPARSRRRSRTARCRPAAAARSAGRGRHVRRARPSALRAGIGRIVRVIRRRKTDDAQQRPHDGPAAVRRQPVLRREPHVGGEGPRPADALPGPRRDMDVLDAAYDEGITHLHVHHPRSDRRGVRPGAGEPGALRRHDLLPVHAVRPQVRERRHRGRLPRAPSAGSCPTRACSTACPARHAARWRARTSRASRPCSSTPS